MSTSTELPALPLGSAEDAAGAERWQELMATWTQPCPSASAAVVVGELVAVAREGHVPLVRLRHAGGTAVLRARSAVDLQRQHVGRGVVVAFEAGDPAYPIVLGVLNWQAGWPLADPPGQVKVDADGERMIVAARQELVLRCGLASITLAASGAITLHGTQILSCASGAHQIQGGTVEIN
jgi:hypothetical protein